MALLSNTGIRAGASAGGGTTVVAEAGKNSLRFNSADSAYLSRTAGAGGSAKKWTFNYWWKFSGAGKGTSGTIFGCRPGSSNDTTFAVRYETDGTFKMTTEAELLFQTTQVFRDPSAWQMMTVVMDTGNGTAGDRFKMYVNGTRITDWGTAATITQDRELGWNKNAEMNIGRLSSLGYYTDIYLANIEFVDGLALAPSDFAETDSTTGQWVYKEYTGAYGTNGFFLNFKDNSAATAAAIGKDVSGNGHNWTPTNISVTAGSGNDSLLDSPINGDTSDDTGDGGEVNGNYCTINPLDTELSMHTLSEGNLKIAGDTTAASGTNARWNGTFGASSGKWYYEVYIDSGNTNQNIGISSENAVATTMGNLGGDYQYTANGNKRNNNSSTSWGNTWDTGNYIGVAYDLDANKLWFSKDGAWQESGDPAAGSNECFALTANKTYRPSGRFYDSTGTFNFGQRPFEHDAPSGFKPLCTAFLSTPAVVKPNEYFDISLYTGTGSSRSVTGLEFEPGFIWIKKRNADEHPIVYDQARGTEKALYTSGTWAEGEWSGEGVSAFNSDGFTIGTSSNANSNGDTFAAFSWQSGETAASASTAGATNATDSWVNTTSKFSITEWEGTGSATTVGHSLGTKPDFIIVMNRDYATNKAVYHSSLGAGKSSLLNSNGVSFTPSPSTAAWNNTEPDDDVFSVGTYNSNNGSGHSMIAYSWAAVPGYSAFGKYTSSGTNPHFIYTDFRPKWMVIKRTDTANNWGLLDSVRYPHNQSLHTLSFNLNEDEAYYSNNYLDILSNGVAIRTTGAWANTSGGTYIWAAFAEAPFKYSRAR